MANNYKRWLCEEILKTPLLATHFNIFWIQKQTFTHYCRLHGPSLAQKIICDKILVSNTLRWHEFLFLYFSFFFSLLFCFIINVYKNYFINFFFHENYFNFFMFRDVPGCSGMFVLNVPCSGFYRRPTQRYFQLVVSSLLPSEYIEDITWQRGDIRILSSSERYFQHEILSQNACHKNVMKLGHKVIKEK